MLGYHDERPRRPRFSDERYRGWGTLIALGGAVGLIIALLTISPGSDRMANHVAPENPAQQARVTR